MEEMEGGAGTGPGRAWSALMSALRLGESFDMVVSYASLMVMCH